jgi:general secretion pathway protein C
MKITKAQLGDWLPSWASLVIFLMLCGSSAYWATELIRPGTRIPPVTATPDAATSSVASLELLMFGKPASAETTNIVLKGTLYEADPRKGIALLVIEGEPARSFRAGQEISPDIRLRSVYADHVIIGRGGSDFRINLLEESAAKVDGSAASAPIPRHNDVAISASVPTPTPTPTAAPPATQIEAAVTKSQPPAKPAANYELRYD